MYPHNIERSSSLDNGIEGLHLELSFTIYGLVKSKFPRETVGARHLSDTAMLIPFSTDLISLASKL
jgi:hypothetical protein